MKRISEDIDEEDQEAEEDSASLSGFTLLFAAGFILVLIGVILVMVASAFGGDGSASSGIIIFVGPFPIVFGAGPNVGWLILIGVILAALSVVIFVLMRRKMVEEVG